MSVNRAESGPKSTPRSNKSITLPTVEDIQIATTSVQVSKPSPRLIFPSSRNYLRSKFDLVCTLKSAATMAAIGGLSRIWIAYLNNTKVVGLDNLIRCIKNEKPLITVANHTACLDDPLLWGILPWNILLARPRLMRWTLAAKEICFTNPVSSKFFSLGRCLPTIRGEGVYQESVDFTINVLENSGWVHIFPEGKVNLLKEKMRLKWGVGRIIHDCKLLPTVIPMWHVGMDDILPNKKPRWPQIGKKLTVAIGDPIDIETVIKANDQQDLTAAQCRANITQKIQDSLERLKLAAEAYHSER